MKHKVLVTGAGGFIGKNLVVTLRQRGYEVFEFDRTTSQSELQKHLLESDIVYHTAGVNRPNDPREFKEVNFGLTKMIVKLLGTREIPIVMTSSIQAELDNDYGKSKKAAEDYLKEHCKKARIYRLPNVFGKWSRPNYNSVIATWCYNTARSLPIQVNDKEIELTITYIDDVVDSLVDDAELITYKVSLGELESRISSYKNRTDAPVQDDLGRKLYATYLSYMPEDEFSHPLKMNIDDRGSFTEILHTPERGQFSVNIIKPGVTKGNHWHHTKNEKFLIVSGEGVISLRRLDEQEIIKYELTGDNMRLVDIPPGYVHNIKNTGGNEMVCFMWANEIFDADHPDTFYEEV